MHRQSITPTTLKQLITRSDFKGIPSAMRSTHADQLASSAYELYNKLLPFYPLRKWILREKWHFAPDSKPGELLLRKLSKNLMHGVSWQQTTRDGIVENLKHLLTEGVPYRLYRLDISNFYESISLDETRQMIEDCDALAPCTKAIADTILHYQILLGEQGIPRGLAISAILSELMMRKFDLDIINDKEVFFYARYVDDIIIISANRENPDNFISRLENALPNGLVFNKKKFLVKSLAKSEKDPAGQSKLDVEYLGYEFSVFNSVTGKTGASRKVLCSISEKKIKKIKTRIFRALADYGKNANDDLLVDRIKFLTSNFKVYNKNTGYTNMAGIYFNYSLIDSGDEKLKFLDKFLSSAILSTRSVKRRGLSLSLSNVLCKRLLRLSFQRGHTDQIFTSFSGNRLEIIGRCWKY